MSRGLYLIGAPGVGKSAAMSELRDVLAVATDPDGWYRERGELHVEPLVDMLDVQQGFSLGRTREKFSGTDALSLSASRDATAWALDPDVEPPALLLGEGARLMHAGFLAPLALKLDHLVVAYLRASDATLAQRRAGRTMKEVFVKGQTTRAAAAAARARDAGLLTVVMDIDTLTPRRVAECLAEELES